VASFVKKNKINQFSKQGKIIYYRIHQNWQ